MRNKRVDMSSPPVVDTNKIRKIDNYDVKNFKQSNNSEKLNQNDCLVQREEVSSALYKYPSTKSNPHKV